MTKVSKQTPLYGRHSRLGAVLTDFHGWSMPLWYPSGAVAEHRRVITHAGLFDTSHMAVVLVEGAGAFELLQLCATRDLAACVGGERRPMRVGDCVLAAYLNPTGGCIDDTIIYMTATDRFISIVNAGMGGAITDHLRNHGDGLDVVIKDMTGLVGKMDLQGPASARIIRKTLKDPDRVLADMDYFTFRGHWDESMPGKPVLLVDGTPVLLSRTGYSGEFGFEILVEPESLPSAWDLVLSAGEEWGLIPCGLAARDSLRAGAVLPLSGQDIGPWPFINHPWEFALPWDKDKSGFTKRFVGDSVLSMRGEALHTRPFVGFDPRKVSPDAAAVVLDSEGSEIGTVTTCVADMALGRSDGRVLHMLDPNRPGGFKPRGLVCGFVRVEKPLAAGEIAELKDDRRRVKVEIANDVRPGRTARRPMDEMLEWREGVP
jgi:aminomethyltransferase